MAAEKASETLKAIDRFYSEVIMGPGFVYLLGIAFFIFCIGLIVLAFRFLIHHLVKLIQNEELNIAFSAAGFQLSELKNLDLKYKELIDQNSESIQSLQDRINGQDDLFNEIIDNRLIELKSELEDQLDKFMEGIEESLNDLDAKVLQVECSNSDLDSRVDDLDSEISCLRDGC